MVVIIFEGSCGPFALAFGVVVGVVELYHSRTLVILMAIGRHFVYWRDL